MALPAHLAGPSFRKWLLAARTPGTVLVSLAVVAGVLASAVSFAEAHAGHVELWPGAVSDRASGLYWAQTAWERVEMWASPGTSDRAVLGEAFADRRLLEAEILSAAARRTDSTWQLPLLDPAAGIGPFFQSGADSVLGESRGVAAERLLEQTLTDYAALQERVNRDASADPGARPLRSLLVENAPRQQSVLAVIRHITLGSGMSSASLGAILDRADSAVQTASNLNPG